MEAMQPQYRRRHELELFRWSTAYAPPGLPSASWRYSGLYPGRTLAEAGSPQPVPPPASDIYMSGPAVSL